MTSPEFTAENERHEPIGDVTTTSGVANTVARYRYVVQVASHEAIAGATSEALSSLRTEDRVRVIELLVTGAGRTATDTELAAHSRDPEPLSRVAADAEKREPGALERWLGAGSTEAASESLWLIFVSGFVRGDAARSLFSALRQGSESASPETDPDPDFSEEFGYERGFAGGEGFENVEFERWV